MRKLAWCAAFFAAAVVLCCYLLPMEYTLWAGGLCALLSLSALLLRGTLRTRVLLGLLSAAVGFLWFAGWTAVFVTPAMELADTTATVTVTVVDDPTETENGVSVGVRLEDGTAVQLYLRSDCEAVVGDRLTVTARFVRSDLFFEETSTYYTARGVFLLAYADAVERHPTDSTPLRLLPRVWAHRLSEGIWAVFPTEYAALECAVTLGDRSGLSDGHISLFNRSGLAHLLVVSGLHLSILLAALQMLLRRHRRLFALVGVAVLLLFTLMVGCTPSAVRAALMNTLLLVSPMLKRESDPPTALGAALLVLLLQNPYAAASVSLQLSFASVAGILLVTQPLQGWFLARMGTPAETRWGRAKHLLGTLLWGNLSVTLGAMLFTTPLIALWFGVVSIVSPLSNLLCLWAVELLLVGGLLCGVLAIFSSAVATPLAWLTGLACRYVLWVVQTLGSLSFSALSLESVYYRIWFVGVYVLVGLLLSWRRGWSKHPTLVLSTSVLTLCAAALLTRLTYTVPALTVTVLDVGQGLSTAFFSGGYTMLVDCGGSGSHGAGDVAADYFQAMGESTLDLLVFTHLDSDHFNGADELFDRMDILAVALPDRVDEYGRREELERMAAEEGAQIYYITETMTATLGTCDVTLYPPLGSGTSNEEGLFVLCSAGEFDVLITGDADSAVESMLVKYYDVPDIEVLVVGHHGSNGSTSAAFLQAVRPEYAIISVGDNSYGHPHSAVLERLTEAGAEIYRTDEQGSVTISVGTDGSLTQEDG